jgi:hypothetical protein
MVCPGNSYREALDLWERLWKGSPPDLVAVTAITILSAGRIVSDQDRHRVELWLEDALGHQPRPRSTQLLLCMAILKKMKRQFDRS